MQYHRRIKEIISIPVYIYFLYHILYYQPDEEILVFFILRLYLQYKKFKCFQFEPNLPFPHKSTICSYAPACICIVKWRMNCLYASKLKLPVLFQKRNWNFAFAFEHLWLDHELLNLLFPLKFHPANLERQLNYLKCFVTMPFWQSNNLGIILCYQGFLLHCNSLNCWKLISFLESIWFFLMIFKTRVFDYFSQFICCVKRASNYFCC